MPPLPPYRLQALLEVRQRKKDAAERALMEAMLAMQKERKKLAEMELELERMVTKRETRRREYLEKAMQGEISALDAINSNKYLERLIELEAVQKDAIDGQKALLAQRQEDVENARQALVIANQELKALEKHKENWLEKVKKDRMSKEEEAMDELAQTIYLRGDRSRGGNN